MKTRKKCLFIAMAVLALSTLNSQLSSVMAFEGRINAAIAQGGQPQALLYTVGTNFLRVENTATNWPNPVDIVDRNSGALTLLFPHNRSFVRLKPVPESSSATPPGFPPMPGAVPPGVGPQGQPSGMTASPAMPSRPNMPAGGGMPAMPAMPMMPVEKMELKATGGKTNLLGLACQQYEIKQRGETMEIWATDQLFPFQPYVQNQPHRFGPRMIEEQWPELVKAGKLFPLIATLRFDQGAERYRFEVQSISPEKLTDADTNLFQPPPGYFEIQPLPF
jgi:hypothetical protein